MWEFELCGTSPLTAATVPTSHYTYSTYYCPYVHPKFFTAGVGAESETVHKLCLILNNYSLTYLLTPCNTVPLEKLTSLQLVKKVTHFIESEGSLPDSQVPVTCPYPQPAWSSPYPHNPLPQDPFDFKNYVIRNNSKQFLHLHLYIYIYMYNCMIHDCHLI